MILEEMFNGRFYPCETVVADSPRFKQAVKASADLMDTLSERLSKEDYALVEELRAQMAIAQCEENESHFKYGFSAGLAFPLMLLGFLSSLDRLSIRRNAEKSSEEIFSKGICILSQNSWIAISSRLPCSNACSNFSFTSSSA